MSTTLKTYSFLILSAMLLFWACQKHDTSPVPRFTATLNGQSWEANNVTQIKATMTNGQISITPFISGITLFFDGDIPGSYSTGRDQYSFAIAEVPNYTEWFYSNLEDLNTGVLEITRIDKVRKLIDGKFSFTAKNESGVTATVEEGIFEDISYTEEPSNTDKKPMRGWIEENGKKYALNSLTYNNNTLGASTSSQSRFMTFYWNGSSFYNNTFDLTAVGSIQDNPRLTYYVPGSGIIGTLYDPAPGSKFNMAVPPGSATSFLGSLDIVLLKDYGPGPDTLHLKSEFEVYKY